jgi:hypothetical protein
MPLNLPAHRPGPHEDRLGTTTVERVRWMNDRGHRYLLACVATQSLLTAPERKPADISIVETARPGSEGVDVPLASDECRQHPGRGRAPNPGQPNVPG